MAHAYTPGLKVARDEVVRKQRRLPLKGDVVVGVGDSVTPNQIVAHTEIPGDPESVNMANLLGIESSDVPGRMFVNEGDEVEKGQVVAVNTAFFGLIKNERRAPITGVVEMISPVTGQVLFRHPPVPLDVKAYVRGRVAEVIPEEGVIVETRGALIQGIFGVGGEHQGDIRVMVDRPDAVLDPSDIDSDCEGQILVVGLLATSDMLYRAAEVGAVGVVAGGIIDEDLVDYLGYDIGVAITGQEDIPLALIVTEGFGPMEIAPRTFELLQELEGRYASMTGATQIRAGVMRPEIVCPHDDQEEMSGADTADELAMGLGIGTPIRIIREPYFGEQAEVIELPLTLEVVESEARVRVLKARLEDGTEVVVPRANVEIIEG